VATAFIPLIRHAPASVSTALAYATIHQLPNLLDQYCQDVLASMNAPIIASAFILFKYCEFILTCPHPHSLSLQK
jgi:hypothetical protein